MSGSPLLLLLAAAFFATAVFFTRRALVKGSDALNRNSTESEGGT